VLNVLVIGYGNPNREDDGVSWHLLQKLANHYGCPITSMDELDLRLSQNDGAESYRNSLRSADPPTPPLLRSPAPHLAFALQLTPEMAETLTRYERVCFVDAHTGAYPEEIRLAPLSPGYQAAPFTHHLTPESCLALAYTLYGRVPEAALLSIRGYHFGYSTELSGQTAALLDPALGQIIDWLSQGNLPAQTP
jgi:Ni,Fe-hydrogenase maturation factor